MVHKFTLFDTNIVLDVNSGSVHIFDDLSMKLLEQYKNYKKDELISQFSDQYSVKEIVEALDEIETLEKEGCLFSEDVYEAGINKVDKPSNVKALCLHVAHDCNMSCKYCFASKGDYRTNRSLMSVEVGKKSIDFVINSSGNRRNIEVDFFGGEPLLNFDVVKEVVDYARSLESQHQKKFRFTITTNGLLLNDEINSYINQNMENVVLSIDGRETTNDQMRSTRDGRGTYKDIMPKLKEMAMARNQDNYYVRGTYTSNNLDFSKDVLHLANEGFKQISVEPVVANNGSGYELKEDDLAVLFDEYEILAKEYVKRSKQDNWFNFFHFMLDLSGGPCVVKRVSGCGSGSDYIAITPEGDIYPCHQFVGMDDFKMGNVNYGINNTEIGNQFKESNVYKKTECTKCWAKFFCSGGCAANAYQFNGDIDKPYKIACELQKKRIECALWIKSQE